MASGRRTAEVLKRYGEMSEATGDQKAALDAWRELLAGLDAGSPPWFEARYQTLRLLYAREPERAREAMGQHKVLYPGFGPEPWGGLIKGLDEQMGTVQAKPQAALPGGGGS
jgi:hypothetical protein